ncbi:hypothetical protein [Psychroflexus aestuariivivens]|nr:hypothetical protein [Psychroflexus aestuariivivens]
MKTKKVKILRAHNNSELENKINELLAKDWKITNNLAIDESGYIYTIMKQ